MNEPVWAYGVIYVANPKKNEHVHTQNDTIADSPWARSNCFMCTFVSESSILGDAEWEIGECADTALEGRNVVQKCFAFLFHHNVVLEATLSIIYNLHTGGNYHVKVPPHAVLRSDGLDQRSRDVAWLPSHASLQRTQDTTDTQRQSI